VRQPDFAAKFTYQCALKRSDRLFQAHSEPLGKLIECHPMFDYIDNQIVNRLIIGNIYSIGASLDKKLHQQPRGALVAIHEPMSGRDAIKQGRRLPMQRAVISVIGPAERGKQVVSVGQPGASRLYF
jgi:hypothetical protein